MTRRGQQFKIIEYQIAHFKWKFSPLLKTTLGKKSIQQCTGFVVSGGNGEKEIMEVMVK